MNVSPRLMLPVIAGAILALLLAACDAESAPRQTTSPAAGATTPKVAQTPGTLQEDPLVVAPDEPGVAPPAVPADAPQIEPAAPDISVDGYLAACELALATATAKFRAQAAAYTGSDGVTWGQFALLHDLIEMELAPLMPPPELENHHQATVEMVDAVRTMAGSRRGGDSLAEVLVGLLVGSISLDSLELDPKWSAPDPSPNGALEAHLEQEFAAFFGAELIAATESLASARAQLPDELNAALAGSTCLYGDAGSNDGIVPEPIAASLILLDRIA